MAHELADVEAAYDRWAAVYDHDGNPLVAIEEPAVRAAAGDVKGLDVLDLGCGTGRHAIWLARDGARVTAVDFSQGMIDQAKRKAGTLPISFIRHDLHESLPLQNEVFDLVVSGLVLEHLRELGPFFAQVHRVLKPSGRAIISAMHPAMFLRGTQARFTDPVSGQIVQPGSIAHSISDFVMAAVGTGLGVKYLAEFSADGVLAAKFPRALKYVGWPMLVVIEVVTSPEKLSFWPSAPPV